MTIIAERVAGRIEGEYVVFLIGMRVNHWWKVHRWLPVAMAMPKMIQELESAPELGFLGAASWFGRTTMMVSYWRSIDHLMNYAMAKDKEHLPAWQRFNKAVGTNGDVGIWHETYRVHPGDYEAIYVNMPRFGLGAAGEIVPATGRRMTARKRLDAGAAAHADAAES